MWARIMDTVTVLALVVAIAIGTRVLLDWAAQVAEHRDREIEAWPSLAAEGHRMGPSDATVVIVEWGDYQCPGCRSIAPILDELRDTYPDDLAVVYRHWPLTLHPFAFQAARTAECAARQGMFEPVHAALNRDGAWARTVEGDSIAGLMALAAEAGVTDTTALRSCVASGAPDERINRDIEAVRALETRGTPTLIINGVYAASVLTPGDLRERVAEAVAAGNRP